MFSKTEPKPPASLWPKCDWCGADLERFAQDAGICLNKDCRAMKFPKDAEPKS